MSSSDDLLRRLREGGTLTGKDQLSLILRLSIPSILAQITVTLMFFIDAAMVGALGAEASAAIGLMETTLWLFGSLSGCCTLGFGVCVAQSVGARRFDSARAVLRTGISTSVGVSCTVALIGVAIHKFLPTWLGGGSDILAMASTYFLIYCLSLPLFALNSFFGNMLKCSGNMRTPSLLSIAACVLDVVFNFLCIYPSRVVHIYNVSIPVVGMGLGVAGAALGSGLAIALTLLLMSRKVLVASPILALRHDRGTSTTWCPQRWILRKMLSVSLPMTFQQSLLNIAQMLSTVIVAPLGNVALAANNFAITAEALCYMPGFGIGDAATTVVGQAVGAQRWALCRSLAYRCVAVGMAVMALMGLIMYLTAPQLMAVMSPVDDIVALGAHVLRIEAFAEPFFAAAIISSSCMVAAGYTIVPACLNLSAIWLIRLPLAAILAPIMGLTGAWIGMATELTARGLLFLTTLCQGRWLRYAQRKAATNS